MDAGVSEILEKRLGAAPGFSCPHVFVCQEAWWRWGVLLRTSPQILPGFAGGRSMKNMESRKWGQKDKDQFTAKGDLTGFILLPAMSPWHY
jgi:hypothetical protein